MKSATAVKKEKKLVPATNDEVLLQELQKIRQTFVDVSTQVSKQLTNVVASST